MISDWRRLNQNWNLRENVIFREKSVFFSFQSPKSAN